MARARNIKPGFFTNDVLGELDPLARLLFAGLWTIADRAGRLEDRPRRIKAELLAYDNCDCDALLADLHGAGFIKRYVSDGVRYIQVVTWEKHQNPHVKEAASSIPECSQHQTSTVLERCEEQPLQELAGLIPDSGFRIPDSIEEPPTEVVGKPAAPRPPDCPTQSIVDLYHLHCPTLPRVEVLSDSRKRAISARWREVVADPEIRGSPDVRGAALEWFAWMFGYVAQSAFLSGRAKDWRADIDFLMTASKFPKVVEGHYHKDRIAA